MNTRFIAVDWSGAIDKPEQKIWLAEINPTLEVVRLECGRNRSTVIDHLVDLTSQSPDIVVGLDFAFSLPSWYLASRDIPDAQTLWTLAGSEGEQWLATCDPPFWGRPGRKRPENAAHLRRTEKNVPVTAGISPKSVFQVGGAGAVGTGSIRGMPFLSTLRNGGYSIWPFDEPKLPLVVEIYPRLLTGAVNKGNPQQRRDYLDTHHPDLAPDTLDAASQSEDAFDALVSAIIMAQHASSLLSLPSALDQQQRLEGEIWAPIGPATPDAKVRGQRNSSKTRVVPVFDALAPSRRPSPNGFVGC